MGLKVSAAGWRRLFSYPSSRALREPVFHPALAHEDPGRINSPFIISYLKRCLSAYWFYFKDLSVLSFDCFIGKA
jgi:hypothetical protein